MWLLSSIGNLIRPSNNNVPAQPVAPIRDAPRDRVDARIHEAVQRQFEDDQAQLTIVQNAFAAAEAAIHDLRLAKADDRATIGSLGQEVRDLTGTVQQRDREIVVLRNRVAELETSDPILALFGKMGRGIEDSAKYLGGEIDGTAKYLGRQMDGAVGLILCY